MKNQKHTPGPWSLNAGRTLCNVKGANGEQICQLPLGEKNNPCSIPYTPDARLIAAAPGLLEALELAKNRLLDVSGTYKALRIAEHKEVNDVLTVIYKAIDKATGGAE